MEETKKISSALISVYDKEGLEPLVKLLSSLGVKLFSTGGTKDFIEKLGIKATAVEEITSYPSILGGRVKTLHPKVFGGILARRENANDAKEMETHAIPFIDLVIVDLYPFEATVASGDSEENIIEKIDIGGISLVRAAAKNFKDVVIVSSKADYAFLLELLKEKKGSSGLDDRKLLAERAFQVSSQYDTSIFKYFAGDKMTAFKESISPPNMLRYGENPHQKGVFFGDLDAVFEKLNGKELSYNNLLDLDAGLNLLAEFTETTFIVIKHNNPCGTASGKDLCSSWKDALAADPLSAFGGVLLCNREVDLKTAEEITKIFFEVLAAPGFQPEALELLKQKKNRILLKTKSFAGSKKQFRTLLNGVLQQEKDNALASSANMKTVTEKEPSVKEKADMEFAEKIVKHAKSNTIVLARDKKILGIGAGLTSRVDALKHAIAKAKEAGLDLQHAVMASDAFFPFPDCVEIAHGEGITAVIQPGGSMKDNESIDYCNKNKMAMVFTSIRHFKH